MYEHPADRIGPAPARPSAARLEDALFVACGLAWGAALIHVQAALDHIQEYALYAVFFALLAPAQFAWGVVVYRRPGRRVLYAGAIVSLMVVALWIASRTSGLPIGPTPWEPEPVGATDVVATADECLLALLAFLSLRTGRTGAIGRRAKQAVMAAGTCLILVSSIALIVPAHGH